jgi:hypothetical protein
MSSCVVVLSGEAATDAAESVEERGPPKGNAAMHVLVLDTAGISARQRRVRLRLVEMLYLDRCTLGPSRVR